MKEKKMEKIIVIGSPGAGKSSFSKKLKNITDFNFHLRFLPYNANCSKGQGANRSPVKH